MAVVVPAPAALSGDLTLFHTTDPLLNNAPVLVFHGSAATIGATSSRIQVHVFTPAGHVSYARLAVSPNSPFYSAVSNLPREEQGDETVRGLAFGLKKYFVELPELVKNIWCAEAKAPAPAALFGDDHVAILASRMTRIENVDEVIGEIEQAFGDQKQSWLDLDVVLPSGSIKETSRRSDSAGLEDFDEAQQLSQRYGRYAELVDSFGDITFMPTSKLKRAPSKASAVGRSASFLKQQKENVRKEISELVDTESSYVDRISELQALSIALEDDVEGANVFPQGLGDIVKLNSDFLADLRSVLEATEEGALQDIESMTEQQPDAQQARQDFVADTQGIGALAKCLSDWFPKFGDSYRLYLGSHSDAAQSLRTLLRDQEAAPAAQLQEVGEQKLTSLLIEPVQRLPRYSLYIDTIIKQLPARHPATKRLLKARDIITEICESCNEAGDQDSVAEKLQTRVSGWPAGTHDFGRLVTAADYVELQPPYALTGCDGEQGIMVLFSDSVVFLAKRRGTSTSARTLLTELESGRPPTRHAASIPGTPHNLHFLHRMKLDAVDCLEALSGQVIQILTSSQPDSATVSTGNLRVDSCQILKLEGFYDSKAERLAEEITKARVEGRFSEAEREGLKWEVRASDPAADNATLLSAVFEDSEPAFVDARSSNAPTRVVVDIDRHSQRPRAGQNGLRTVVSLSPLRDGLWRLSVDSLDGNVPREQVQVFEVVPMLRRKLSSLQGPRFSISQSSITPILLSKNADILLSLHLQASAQDDGQRPQTPHRERYHRPKSPKKLLSSFLSSTGSGGQPSPFLKKELPPLPPPGQLSRGSSFNQSMSKPPSRESRPPSRDQLAMNSTPSMRSTEQLANPIKKLEDTLSSYILALQARKGNIVGRSLKMRASADELAVNELYNSLLEDPYVMALAAQATVDVLFAAFEKFLNIAWKDQIGQVLPFATIQAIQSKAEALFPRDFDEYFRNTVNGLSPQNQRAFKNIMKLLSDLLDGTGNDGDRGALTAAFAEVLITEGNPHDYIALIDRFVDDPDTYFGEPLEDAQRVAEGAPSLHKRARSANSASLTSNTSSLRRKFGFGNLSRENSKSEQESKVSSVWRTLSKTGRGEQSPAGSISRGTLLRAHSTDTDVRAQTNRPVSQDGSMYDTSMLGDASFISSSSAQNLGLSTIGEHPSFIPTQPPRKKRRSSLSDLKTLEVSQAKSPPVSPPSARRPPAANRYEDKSLPESPMPSTPSSKGGSGRFGSPSKEPARSLLPSSFRKENSPGHARTPGAAESRPKSSGAKLDEVVITARPTSGIPTFAARSSSIAKTSPTASRNGLAERPGAGNIVKRPSPSPEKALRGSALAATENGSRSKKLRMQSPQKLRERLQNEQSSVAAAHTLLQDELTKIGDELTSTPSRTGSVRPRTKAWTDGSNGSSMDLAQRVLKMEGQLPKQVEDLSTRIKGIQADLATSLAVSETKCKKLDELYREANGENEALYSRFNDELSRILKAVKGGEGTEELKKKLKESQEEAAKLKRENGRLKRENVGLRAQLRE